MLRFKYLQMKTKFILPLLFFYFSISATTYHVLYLGNSLTYVNDVPALVNQIAISKGDTIVWSQNTPGGHQLAQHATNPTSLSLISAYKWDIVVIQAQSQQTAFPDGQLKVEVYPPCKFLVDSIHRNHPCTRVMYYMPAGWKYGDNMNCPVLPDICTYEGQFGRIRKTHLNLIDSTEASIIPSGVSYRVSRLQDSTLDLWSSDNVHPSLAGSYLTALNMYASFTNKPTYGSSFGPIGLTTANIVYLQQIADSVVFDSLSTWKLDMPFQILENNFVVNDNLTDASGIDINRTYAVYVNDASAIYDSVYYFYRVSSTSRWNPCTNINDTLFFNDTLCFDQGQILQVVEACGVYDSLINDAFEPCFLSIESTHFSNTFTLYPNPASDKIIIEKKNKEHENYSIEIVDINGRKIIESDFDDNISTKVIDVSKISSGMYYVVLKNKMKTYSTKLIKE